LLMTVQHLLKTVAFGFLGFAFSLWMPLIAAMIVSGFLGTVAGRQVLARIDEKRFKFVLNAILIVLALRLIWAGGQGVIQG
ncbi:MAG: sulfite exporter TauE/SafE family protein, partial [Limibaculum sp.]